MKNRKIQFEKEANDLANKKTNNLILLMDNIPLNDLLLLSKYLLKKGKFILIFASLKDKQIFLGHNVNLKINLKDLLNKYLLSFNGRGGGSFNQAQISFENFDIRTQ